MKKIYHSWHKVVASSARTINANSSVSLWANQVTMCSFSVLQHVQQYKDDSNESEKKPKYLSDLPLIEGINWHLKKNSA